MGALQWGRSSTSDPSAVLLVSSLVFCFSPGRESRATPPSRPFDDQRKSFWIIRENRHQRVFRAPLPSLFWPLRAVSVGGHGTNLFAHRISNMVPTLK